MENFSIVFIFIWGWIIMGLIMIIFFLIFFIGFGIFVVGVVIGFVYCLICG